MEVVDRDRLYDIIDRALAETRDEELLSIEASDNRQSAEQTTKVSANLGDCSQSLLLTKACALVLVFVLILGFPAQSSAYAVLAHEAIIDSAWDTNIRPLLLQRFPLATGPESEKLIAMPMAEPLSRTWAITRTEANFLVI